MRKPRQLGLRIFFARKVVNSKMEEQNNSFLATEKPGRLMRKYAIPCIISLLIGAWTACFTQCLFLIYLQLFCPQSSLQLRTAKLAASATILYTLPNGIPVSLLSFATDSYSGKIRVSPLKETFFT